MFERAITDDVGLNNREREWWVAELFSVCVKHSSRTTCKIITHTYIPNLRHTATLLRQIEAMSRCLDGTDILSSTKRTARCNRNVLNITP